MARVMRALASSICQRRAIYGINARKVHECKRTTFKACVFDSSPSLPNARFTCPLALPSSSSPFTSPRIITLFQSRPAPKPTTTAKKKKKPPSQPTIICLAELSPLQVIGKPYERLLLGGRLISIHHRQIYRPKSTLSRCWISHTVALVSTVVRKHHWHSLSTWNYPSSWLHVQLPLGAWTFGMRLSAARSNCRRHQAIGQKHALYWGCQSD
ncbi:hypothetical protein QBC43DRAFT_98136 [Cladorrhinum sp. PSN259]|nr:hypothetical protein QBC43DRAFT_98136 [Cladorrhinum sp. PSN259]